MSSTPTYDSERQSITSLIGWISLCLLAAGWGALLDSSIRQLWVHIGLFGLTSALGLEIVQRKRIAYCRRKQERVANSRAERNLTRLTTANATVEQLDAALRRITEDYQESAPSKNERFSDLRFSWDRQVQVKLLTSNRGLSAEEDRSQFAAYIRDLSPGGVGLVCNQSIPTGRVILSFTLKCGETISIVAELLWQQRQLDGRYSSGGKLIEVSTPVSPCESETAGVG